MTTNDITGIYHKRLSAATAPLIGSIISQCFSEGRGRESRVEKGKGKQVLGGRHNRWTIGRTNRRKKPVAEHCNLKRFSIIKFVQVA